MASELAPLLAEAWKTGNALKSISAGSLPADRAQAYAVQDQMAQLLGSPTIGWKVGATSEAVQRAEGYDGPLPGRIFAERTVASGAQVPAMLCRQCKLELEIAFRARHDIHTASVMDLSALDEQFEMLLAFDLTSSRYAPAALPDDGLGRMLAGIADNGNGGYVVTGPLVGPTASFTLRDFDMSIVVNNQQCAQIVPEQRADPLVGLTWVLQMCAARRESVRAGDIVLTGAANVPIALEASAQVQARVANHTLSVAYV